MARNSETIEDICHALDALTSNRLPDYKTYGKDIARSIRTYRKTKDLPESDSLIKLRELITSYFRTDKDIGSIGRFEDSINPRTGKNTLEIINIMIGNESLTALNNSIELEDQLKQKSKTESIKHKKGIKDRIKHFYAKGGLPSQVEKLYPGGTTLILTGLGTIAAHIAYPEIYNSFKNYKEIAENILPITATLSVFGGVLLNYNAYKKQDKIKNLFKYLKDKILKSISEEHVETTPINEKNAEDEFSLINTLRHYAVGTALTEFGVIGLSITAPDLIDTLNNYSLAELVKDATPVTLSTFSTLGGLEILYNTHRKKEKIIERFNYIKDTIIPSLADKRMGNIDRK